MSDAPLHLLLVEDEPTQLLLMRRVLQRAGYKVETASNGEEALGKIAGGQFQILVTDWDMPGMDGVTLCRHVRSEDLPGYLYVLLLTSHGSTESVVAGLEAGADDYIRKPANEAELIARLNAGKRIVRLEQSLREANAQIQRLSITDPLVGIFNRRYLNEQLILEVEHARRYNRPLSVVMADLDHFKAVNDRYGHLAGDDVLKGFVELMRSSVRQASDWVARYGGEEFVIVLPETDTTGAAATAEKIRSRCAGAPMGTSEGQLTITASFGVAALAPSDEPPGSAADTLLRSADAALYRSKRGGRNCVRVGSAD
jgi:diguanylate cyclase (GGDEF)-like protein